MNLTAPWKTAVFRILDAQLLDFIESYNTPIKKNLEVICVSPCEVKDGLTIRWLIVIKNNSVDKTMIHGEAS